MRDPGVTEPEVLALTKRHLASAIGPIAEILVDRAAARSASVEDLYNRLALHIRDEADRKRFVGLVPRYNSPAVAKARSVAITDLVAAERTISPFELESMTEVLTSFIGPVATMIISREN